MLQNHIKIYVHSSYGLKRRTLQRIAIELENLENFTLKYKIDDSWVSGIEEFLLKTGLASKEDLEALKTTAKNIIDVEFKKHEGLALAIDSGLNMDPSYMTVLYGPYVIDDFMKDKVLEPEWITQ